MSLSVIIATYNRAESLRVTLESLCRAERPANVPFEVLVADNNSHDHTRQVCDEFANHLPLLYLFEPRQGKSCALNHAIELAKGELLLFTDDDVDVDPEWLQRYWNASQVYPGTSVFGGRCYARWVRPMPRWMTANAAGLLANVVIQFDLGNVALFRNISFAGANMAVRRQALGSSIRYRHDVSIKGGDYRRIKGAEENLLMQELYAVGNQGLYVPDAVIYHRYLHPATERYVRKWHISAGINEARLGEVKMRKVFLGAPLYYWKQAAVNAVKYILTRWCCPSRIWLQAEIRMAHAWGVVSECRRAKGEGLEAKR